MATKKLLHELTRFMERRYVSAGYMYSGSTHPEYIARELHLVDETALSDLVSTALEQGLIVRRDCAAVSYQLPSSARRALVDKHNLRKVWMSQGSGYAFYPNEAWGEIGMLFAES